MQNSKSIESGSGHRLQSIFSQSRSQRLVLLGALLSTLLVLQSHLQRGQFGDIDDVASYIFSGIFYVSLVVIYSVWLFSKINRSHLDVQNESFHRIAINGLPFLLLAFIAYPNTTDVYSYLHSGLMFAQGVNPYIVPAEAFKSPYSPHMIWRQTSTYGPVSQVLFSFSALFTIFGTTTALYVFKLICLSFHVSSAFLVWKLAKRSAQRNLITLAYLVNPILLFEYVKQAHVDAVLNFIIILSLLLILERRYFWSNVGLLLGVFCKTLPVIWLPLLWLHLFHERLWKSLAWCVVSAVCVIALFSLTILPTFATWISLLNPGVAWQTAGSFHNLLDVSLYYAANVLPAAISQKRYRLVIPFKMLTYGLYVVYFVWLSIRVLRGRDDKGLILDMGWSALILFMLATPWYQPWYAAIFVSFIALLLTRKLDEKTRFFIWTAWIYCVCSTSYYVFAFTDAPRVYFAVVSFITLVPVVTFFALSSRGIWTRSPFRPAAGL